MKRSAPAKEGPDFLTRRQIGLLFRIPQRIVNQWIATGQITPLRTSVLGRGGQRVFYSAAEVKKLALEKRKRGKFKVKR